MIIDSFGNCIEPLDVCPNITGVQNAIPNGMIIDSFGNCIDPSDVCPNIDGIQTTIPNGMVMISGNCVFNTIDLCPAESGIQTTLPCPNGDLCPESGIQTTLPCPSILYPSCVFDGVNVLPETGIDCGGPNCPSCKKPPKFIEN